MFRVKTLIAVNKIFRAPVHPFNLRNSGVKSYAEWQYEKGAETVKFYLEGYGMDEMFKGKTVADIGCGAAGKSLYYAANGAKKVFGVEVLEKYRGEAEKLASDLGLSEKFQFIAADAAALPFADSTIDTIIANDAMEHVKNPEKTLLEMLRVVKKGGRIYINFPPYYHPFGAHLSDAIYIPWVHMIYPEKVLIEAYKLLVSGQPDAEDRAMLRFSKRQDGSEYFSYINKMTIRRFNAMLETAGIKPVYYKEVPLRAVFAPMARLRWIKEMFVKMVVCVIEK